MRKNTHRVSKNEAREGARMSDAVDHYTEAFIDPAPSRGWGFQCFTCGRESTGFGGLSAAESAADEHESCQHDSLSGIDDKPLDDPGKSWRCDECGWVRVGPRTEATR